MSNIPKVNSVSSASPTSKLQLSNALDNRQWDKSLKTSILPDNSIKTMQVTLDKAPQNVTNQNATLSPKQMADHLSRELARRTAQNRAVGGKSRKGFESDLSKIFDDNKDLSSLLENGDSGSIEEFLAYFQSAMARHLKGFEFGNILYDQDVLDNFMAKH